MRSNSYCFCYVVDIGLQFKYLPRYHRRDTLPFSSQVLRHMEISEDGWRLFVCQAGVLVLLQMLNVSTPSEHADLYNHEAKFKTYEDAAYKHLGRFSKIQPDDVLVVFPVSFGASTNTVDWKFVQLTAKDVDLHIFIEATSIDHLCRTIDRMTNGLVSELSLADQKRLIEYVESLRILAKPTSFLVNTEEIDLMSKFYSSWNLEERVDKIRQGFSDSIASCTLYTGRLERYGQSAMNFFLAGIAVLSLAQVSKQMTDALKLVGIVITENGFNTVVGVLGVSLIVWGFFRNLMGPRLGLVLSQCRNYIGRRRYLKKLQQ